jgi:hypothetical protein
MAYKHHSLQSQTFEAQIALEVSRAAPLCYSLYTIVVNVLVFSFDRKLVIV